MFVRNFSARRSWVKWQNRKRYIARYENKAKQKKNKKRKRTISLFAKEKEHLAPPFIWAGNTLVSISKSIMSFLYIFGKNTSVPFKSATKEKKKIVEDVNENDEKSIGNGSVSHPWFVKISSDRKFTVTEDRVVREWTKGKVQECVCERVNVKNTRAREKKGERTGQEKTRW